MQALASAWGDQRGSALLAALALSVVMTILGLALFDLGRIENALVLGNQTDAQAFEVAQAGVERALDRLLRTMQAEQALPISLLPDGVPSWRDGSTAGGTTTELCTGGCDLTTDSTVRAFRDASSAYISSTSFSGGTYAIAFRLLTQGEARNAPFGQTCRIRSLGSVADDNEFCTDLILIRSTGTVPGGPPGYTSTRTLQLLARANASGGLLSGLTMGSQTRSVNGNVNIAGSIGVIETPPGATFAWQFKGGASQQNNWSGLDVNILDRLRPRQLVCPPGRTCTSEADKVESLDAILAIQKPLDQRAVDINSAAATVGAPGDSAAYGRGTASNPLRKGKGPINGVFIADGCVMPCDQNGTYVPGDPASKGSFTGRVDQVYVDGGNITNAYPQGVPTAFPQLTDPTTIGGTTYAHYACPAGSSCAGTTGGTAEFFVSNALNMSASIAVTPTTPAFTINNVPFIDKTTGARLTTGSICWKRAGNPLVNHLEFSTVADCATGSLGYTSAQNPLLVYTTGTFAIAGGSGSCGTGSSVCYSGGAVFLVAPASSSGVTISDNIVTACVSGGADPCSRKFLVDPQSPATTDMLSVLTTGAVGNGNMSFDGHSGDYVMGIFYAAVPPSFATGGEVTFLQQINVVGAVSSSALAMSQVPNFWQVPGLIVPEIFFGGTLPWKIAMVPGFWRICAPGATPTTPTRATGICGYD